MTSEEIAKARGIIETEPLNFEEYGAYITLSRIGWQKVLDEVERLQKNEQLVAFVKRDYELELHKLRAVAEAAEKYRNVVEAIDMGLRPTEERNSYKVRHQELQDAFKAWKEGK